MGYSLVQCRRCGRLFQSWGQAICSECVEYREKSYLLVRDYIYLHPEAIIPEISEGSGVEEPLILEFLKEERLTINDETALKCEKCGKPITHGRYCKQCKAFLENLFFKDSSEPSQRTEQASTRTHRETNSPSKGKDRMHLKFDKK